MDVAAALVEFGRWWLMIGAGIAALFLLFGIDRCDEDARGAYVFRVLMIPGVLLIWPLVLWRWARIEADAGGWMARFEPPRAAHLPAALVLAFLLAVAVAAGFAARQEWPADFAPQLLEEPGA